LTNRETVEAAVEMLMSRENRARRSDRSARKYKAAKRRGRKIPSGSIIAEGRVKIA
jgi:hypothetical protein